MKTCTEETPPPHEMFAARGSSGFRRALPTQTQTYCMPHGHFVMYNTKSMPLQPADWMASSLDLLALEGVSIITALALLESVPLMHHLDYCRRFSIVRYIHTPAHMHAVFASRTIL